MNMDLKIKYDLIRIENILKECDLEIARWKQQKEELEAIRKEYLWKSKLHE